MERKYLVVFSLPAPKHEHAGIKAFVDHYSGGDFQQLFFGNALAYLFTSRRPAAEMDFSTSLLNGDSFLLVELADGFGVRDMHKAGKWLHERRDRR